MSEEIGSVKTMTDDAASHSSDDVAKMLDARLERLEAALMERMNIMLEQRSREQEEAFIARTQLLRDKDQSNAAADQSIQGSNVTISENTVASLKSMKQFADSMVLKVQDIEARLDVLEVRASSMDEQQLQFDSALKQAQPELSTLASRPQQARLDTQTMDDISRSTVKQNAQAQQQIHQLSTRVGEMSTTLGQHTTILNDAPEAQRRFLIVEQHVYKHEEALINMSQTLNMNAQRSTQHWAAWTAAKQEIDQRATQWPSQLTELSNGLRTYIGQSTDRLRDEMSKSIDAITKLTLANKRIEQDRANSALAESQQSSTAKKGTSAMNAETIAELEKTVVKHQNALVQMRDYLTQHQDFIDGVCKSFGIGFSGAEIDEATQKLPVKFILDVVNAQTATQVRLGQLQDDVTTLEKQNADIMKGYKSVRAAIIDDRAAISKVVDTIKQGQHTNGR